MYMMSALSFFYTVLSEAFEFSSVIKSAAVIETVEKLITSNVK